MEKEVKCSCKFVFSKVVLVAGILAGLLLAVLGIVTITSSTSNFYRSPFVSWYSSLVRNVRVSEVNGLSYHNPRLRPNDMMLWEWDSAATLGIMETNQNHQYNQGFVFPRTNAGRAKLSLKNLTVATHYYCVTRYHDYQCVQDNRFYGTIGLRSSVFFTDGPLGSQNFRWTFFIISILTILFGVVMVLGELHVPMVVTKFTFFYYSFVKGVIYVLIGVLCLGMSNYFGLVVAIVMWAVGILNCIYGYKAIIGFSWNTIGARGTTTIVTRREYI